MNSQLKESAFGHEPYVKQKKKLLAKISNISPTPTFSEDLFQKDLANSLEYEEVLNKSLDQALFKK